MHGKKTYDKIYHWYDICIIHKQGQQRRIYVPVNSDQWNIHNPYKSSISFIHSPCWHKHNTYLYIHVHKQRNTLETLLNIFAINISNIFIISIPYTPTRSKRFCNCDSKHIPLLLMSSNNFSAPSSCQQYTRGWPFNYDISIQWRY